MRYQIICITVDIFDIFNPINVCIALFFRLIKFDINSNIGVYVHNSPYIL